MLLTSGSASIAYDVNGTADGGVDLLLIHAGVTDRRSWKPLVDAVGHGRRVVCYDSRGFGETTYQPEPYFAHDDALAVVAAAGLDTAVVVGASWGGRTAINLALEHPERLSGLVLIGTAVAGAPDDEDGVYPEPLATLVRDLERAEQDNDLAEVNRIEAHLWLDGPQAPEGRVGGALRELFLEMNGHALAAADPGDEPHPVDGWSRLEELSMPVLVLVGELDLPEVQQTSRALASRISGARLVELGGVAHLPHFEDDPACLQAIRDFLGGLDGS